MSKKSVLIVVFEPHFSGQGRAVVDICTRAGSEFDFYLICQATNSTLHEHCRVLVKGSLPLTISKAPNSDLFRASRFIRTNGISLIHLHGFEGLLWGHALAVMAGVPIVFTPHTIDMKNQFYFFFIRIAWRMCSWYTAMLITVSYDDQRTIAKRRIVSAAKQKTILYGIGRSPYADIPDTRPHVDGAMGKKWIVQVGHLSYQKNPLCFIRAVPALLRIDPDLAFLLVGEGPLHEQLAAHIQEQHLDSSVILLGYRYDALAITKHALLVVNTSRWEGTPFTLIDACFIGKAIVASAVNGTRDLIEDGSWGLLFKPDAHGELAQKIHILLCHDTLRRELGVNAQRWIQDKYTPEEMGRAHAEAYREVVAQG